MPIQALSVRRAQRPFLILASMVLSSWLAACVYSIDSAIPDDLLRSDAALAGTWYANDSARVVITTSRDQGLLTLDFRNQDGGTQRFHGRLGRLGEKSVLEAWPAFGPIENDPWPMGRSLFVIDARPDEIRARSLAADSVTAALKREGGNFPYLVRGNDLI